MKATEFQEMVNKMLEVADNYIDEPEPLDRINELLWDNFECLIIADDRNYN